MVDVLILTVAEGWTSNNWPFECEVIQMHRTPSINAVTFELLYQSWMSREIGATGKMESARLLYLFV